MAAKSPSLTTLKKYLKSRSHDQLINDIAELYKRIPAVKDYYQVKLNPQEETEVFQKYKKVIKNEFFPAREFGKAQLFCPEVDAKIRTQRCISSPLQADG